MNKILFALSITCCLLSCNKVIDEVELPPFSTFPNPFTDAFNIYVNNNLSTPTFIGLKVLNGSNEVIREFDSATIVPGSSFFMDMSNQEKGIYYVEMTFGGRTFNEPILKAK